MTMRTHLYTTSLISVLSLLVFSQGCDQQTLITETSTLTNTHMNVQNQVQVSSSPTNLKKNDGFHFADTSCLVHLQSVNIAWDPKSGRPLETCTDFGCFKTYTVSVHVDETLVNKGAQVNLLYHSNLESDDQWWSIPSSQFYEVERSNGRVNYNVSLAEHGIPFNLDQSDLVKAELEVIAFVKTSDGMTYWDHNATDQNLILQNDPTGFQYNAVGICERPTLSPDYMPMMTNKADTACRIHFNSSSQVFDQRTGAPVKTCTDDGCFRTLRASVHVEEDLVNAGAQVGLLYRSDLFADDSFIHLTHTEFDEVERVDGYVNYNLLIGDRTIYTDLASDELSDVNIEVIPYLIVGDQVLWDHNATDETLLLTNDPSGYQYNSKVCEAK